MYDKMIETLELILNNLTPATGDVPEKYLQYYSKRLELLMLE